MNQEKLDLIEKVPSEELLYKYSLNNNITILANMFKVTKEDIIERLIDVGIIKNEPVKIINYTGGFLNKTCTIMSEKDQYLIVKNKDTNSKKIMILPNHKPIKINLKFLKKSNEIDFYKIKDKLINSNILEECKNNILIENNDSKI